MVEFIKAIMPNVYAYRSRFFQSCEATLQMFVIAGLISFAMGLLFGVVLTQIGIVLEHLEPDTERDNERRDETYYLYRHAVPGHEHGQQSQHRRDTVQHRNDLLLVEPHCKQPVVEVPLVSLERALPMQYPAEESKDRIGQRQRQRKQRHKESDDLSLIHI